MEKTRPKVTVVTVTFNCEEEIETTIKSVISQDYDNIEYIIVDGASRDGTIEIIKKYEDRLSMWVSEPDKGLYDAMNKAVLMSHGMWINFLNAGDVYENEHVISRMFEDVKNDSSLKVVFGKTVMINKDYSTSLHKTANVNNIDSIIHKYQPYTHQAVFYNITNKEDCLYDTRYRIAADYDVACRYFRKYGLRYYYYVDCVVCRYKAFDGISSKLENRKKALKEKIKVKWRNKMNLIEIIKDIRRLWQMK